jgi:hypothetical protein
MKRVPLLGLHHFEAGVNMNVPHLLAHVRVGLSHVSEHASVKVWFGGYEDAPHGSLTWPPC